MRAFELVTVAVVSSVVTGFVLVLSLERDAAAGNPHAQAALGGLWAWTVER